MRFVSAFFDSFYPFDDMFPDVQGNIATSDPNDLREGDILISWGGGDISPSLYNRVVSSRTYAEATLSTRDRIEWDLMVRAKEMGIPIIGVCRGAQMICALAGGYLIQHINGHGGSSHLIKTDKDDLIKVNSIHHQMMVPDKVDHELIAVAAPALSNVYVDGDTFVEMSVEPEFIYFTKEKGIAVQWHPEGLHLSAPAQDLLFNEINTRIMK